MSSSFFFWSSSICLSMSSIVGVSFWFFSPFASNLSQALFLAQLRLTLAMLSWKAGKWPIVMDSS